MPKVYIGQFPSIDIGTVLRDKCQALRHPRSECFKIHTGGTHSLGPEWGKKSKFTDIKESRPYNQPKTLAEAILETLTLV